MSRTTREARWCPELLRFASPEAATVAKKAWHRALVRTRRFWLWFTVLVATLTLISTVATLLVRRFMPSSPAVVGGLVGGLVGGSFGGFFTWVWRREYRRFLRRRLVEQGIPICIPCGYDTRGLTEPRCPECGTVFDPSLLATDAAPESARDRRGETTAPP